MITIQVRCAMCGKNGPELVSDNIEEFTKESLKERLERRKWIVQFNGKHIDTYCCKKCAE